jgi:hypothetical protein
MKKSKDGFEPCQYYYGDMVSQTLPDQRKALPLRRRWWNFKRHAWYIRILGFRGYFSKMFPSTRLGMLLLKEKNEKRAAGSNFKALNLQPGEWVEVRSAKEIFATLDAQGKLKGLRFTPEMVKFCGKKFRVYKRLEKIILEATGELRKIKTPTVILEGVFCDGKAHGGCDRSCFCFWREAWLKRASPPFEQ